MNHVPETMGKTKKGMDVMNKEQLINFVETNRPEKVATPEEIKAILEEGKKAIRDAKEKKSTLTE